MRGKKIAIIGSHSCGKSIFTHHLASLIKSTQSRRSVKVLEENIREISRHFNNTMNHIDFQHYVIVDQLRREAHYTELYDIAVCDRSTIDPLIYAKFFNVEVADEYVKLAIAHMKTYDIIYFIRPSKEYEIENDGFRMTNAKVRKDIDKLFCTFLAEHDILFEEVQQKDILSFNATPSI